MPVAQQRGIGLWGEQDSPPPIEKSLTFRPAKCQTLPVRQDSLSAVLRHRVGPHRHGLGLFAPEHILYRFPVIPHAVNRTQT